MAGAKGASVPACLPWDLVPPRSGQLTNQHRYLPLNRGRSDKVAQDEGELCHNSVRIRSWNGHLPEMQCPATSSFLVSFENPAIHSQADVVTHKAEVTGPAPSRQPYPFSPKSVQASPKENFNHHPTDLLSRERISREHRECSEKALPFQISNVASAVVKPDCFTKE